MRHSDNNNVKKHITLTTNGKTAAYFAFVFFFNLAHAHMYEIREHGT